MFIQIVQVLEGQPSWATSDSDLSQEWWKKCRNSWFFHVLTLHVLILPVVRMYCIFGDQTCNVQIRADWVIGNECFTHNAVACGCGISANLPEHCGQIGGSKLYMAGYDGGSLRIGWLHLSANKITKHLWIPTSPDCASFPREGQKTEPRHFGLCH